MMKLHFLNGPDRGCYFDLKNAETLVGRSPENHIQIKDENASRRHLRISRKRGKYFIENLNNSTRTLLNGEPLSPGKEYEVQQGHPITLGNTIFVLAEAFFEEEKTTLNPESVNTKLDPADLAVFEHDRPLTHFRNMELLYKVSIILMGSLDLDEIFEKIMDYVFDLLKRIDRGVILFIDDETGELKQITARSKYDGDKKSVFNYSRTVVNKVIKGGKPVVVQDMSQEDEEYLSASMTRIRSVMCVPLISKLRVRGVIYVDSVDRPHGFRKEDLYLLTALSSSGAIALENASVYSNLEKRVRERTKTLQKIKEKLKESEARFKAIFDNMSSGVVVYEAVNNGEDFIVLDVNAADEKIEKIKKREKLGKSVLHVSPGFKDNYLSLLEVLKRVWETGKPENRTISIFAEEKITASREYYVYPLPSGEIVAIYDDVIDKIRAEAEQKALQEQLFRSQKMESIGAFAGGTAHNFRNILQAISGNIEYLEMLYADKPKIEEVAESIYNSVGKGVDLINNLLHFAQKERGYQFVNADLADIIMETHEIIDRVFDKSIQIELDLEKELFVSGNSALLSQVFMNLFTNARDAMPDGGRLLIEAKKMGDRVVANVSDTGYGMDKETLGKIFDPFFTLKEVGKGTGLGLSTTHGIIEQHNGSISVKSKSGQGTTFTIHFPLVKGEKLFEPRPQKELVQGKGQKVLIVDDEPPALDALTKVTESLGYEPISVERPIEALRNYMKWSPDVVLMDRNMPEMDGCTCIREILKIDPDAKIIIVSGYEGSGPGGIDKEMKRHIMGYLTKPFKVEELSHAIIKALEAKKPHGKRTGHK